LGGGGLKLLNKVFVEVINKTIFHPALRL